eukprot:1518191-Pleurochrysis_carterae.AAC.4
MPSAPHAHAPKPGGVASGVRRRPIDITRKLPLVRSQTKELVLDETTAVENFTVGPATRTQFGDEAISVMSDRHL